MLLLAAYYWPQTRCPRLLRHLKAAPAHIPPSIRASRRKNRAKMLFHFNRLRVWGSRGGECGRPLHVNQLVETVGQGGKQGVIVFCEAARNKPLVIALYFPPPPYLQCVHACMLYSGPGRTMPRLPPSAAPPPLHPLLLTCSVPMDALRRLWAKSGTICCTAQGQINLYKYSEREHTVRFKTTGTAVMSSARLSNLIYGHLQEEGPI